MAGLRLPRPAAPSTDKERAELERKSATQRGEEAGRKVQQLLGEQNERKEVTDTFVRQHAGSLRRLLKAGGVTLTLTLSLTPTLTLTLTPTLTLTLALTPTLTLSLTSAHHAVDHAHEHDHAAEGVVVRVEDERAQRARGAVGGRRHLLGGPAL